MADSAHPAYRRHGEFHLQRNGADVTKTEKGWIVRPITQIERRQFVGVRVTGEEPEPGQPGGTPVAQELLIYADGPAQLERLVRQRVRTESIRDAIAVERSPLRALSIRLGMDAAVNRAIDEGVAALLADAVQMDGYRVSVGVWHGLSRMAGHLHAYLDVVAPDGQKLPHDFPRRVGGGAMLIGSDGMQLVGARTPWNLAPAPIDVVAIGGADRDVQLISHHTVGGAAGQQAGHVVAATADHFRRLVMHEVHAATFKLIPKPDHKVQSSLHAALAQAVGVDSATVLGMRLPLVHHIVGAALGAPS